MKFYVVKKGRQPGIYRTWPEAKVQVSGYSGAEYKSFTQISDATHYLNWNAETQAAVLAPGEMSLQAAIAKIKQAAVTPAPAVSKHSAKPESAVTIYTDGGTRNTGNYRGGHVRPTDKAAWAYLIEWNQRQVSGAGGEYGASNNKMEQTALIEALKKLLALGLAQQELTFVLDSKYVLNAIKLKWLAGWKKRGWKRSNGPLANVAQWQALDRLLVQFPYTKFEWTKGHANNRGNEYVDHKLNGVMDRMPKKQP
ncbi:MAG: ribonuclease H1 domain-containing protein [Lactobacillus sp.]